MAEPAVQAAVEAVIAKVEAIVPTIDPASSFRRRSEKAPPSTRAGKRWFDLQASGIPRDLSNEGSGPQRPGVADRVARLELLIDYPVARAERTLEMTMLVDSELLLRAVGRSANWAGTPVHRVVASTSVQRDQVEPITGQGSGVLRLALTCEITYRDVE